MSAEAVLDGLVCPEHTALHHFAIHEAGHAVFAVLLGFPFTKVTVQPPASLLAAYGHGETVAGGVYLVQSPRTWVPPNRLEEAMDFVTAGYRAESHELGHHYPQGWVADIRVLGTGMGWDLHPPSREELRGVLGRSDSRMSSALPENISAIRRVRDALLAQRPIAGGEFDSPLVLTVDEVAGLIEE